MDFIVKAKALVHKRAVGVFAFPSMKEEGSQINLEPTDIPLLQPMEATMEGLRDRYIQDLGFDHEVLKELDKYELVEVRVIIPERNRILDDKN